MIYLTVVIICYFWGLFIDQQNLQIQGHNSLKSKSSVIQLDIKHAGCNKISIVLVAWSVKQEVTLWMLLPWQGWPPVVGQFVYVCLSVSVSGQWGEIKITKWSKWSGCNLTCCLTQLPIAAVAEDVEEDWLTGKLMLQSTGRPFKTFHLHMPIVKQIRFPRYTFHTDRHLWT